MGNEQKIEIPLTEKYLKEFYILMGPEAFSNLSSVKTTGGGTLLLEYDETNNNNSTAVLTGPDGKPNNITDILGSDIQDCLRGIGVPEDYVNMFDSTGTAGENDDTSINYDSAEPELSTDMDTTNHDDTHGSRVWNYIKKGSKYAAPLSVLGLIVQGMLSGIAGDDGHNANNMLKSIDDILEKANYMIDNPGDYLSISVAEAKEEPKPDLIGELYLDVNMPDGTDVKYNLNDIDKKVMKSLKDPGTHYRFGYIITNQGDKESLEDIPNSLRGGIFNNIYVEGLNGINVGDLKSVKNLNDIPRELRNKATTQWDAPSIQPGEKYERPIYEVQIDYDKIKEMPLDGRTIVLHVDCTGKQYESDEANNIYVYTFPKSSPSYKLPATLAGAAAAVGVYVYRRHRKRKGHAGTEGDSGSENRDITRRTKELLKENLGSVKDYVGNKIKTHPYVLRQKTGTGDKEKLPEGYTSVRERLGSFAGSLKGKIHYRNKESSDKTPLGDDSGILGYNMAGMEYHSCGEIGGVKYGIYREKTGEGTGNTKYVLTEDPGDAIHVTDYLNEMHPDNTHKALKKTF